MKEEKQAITHIVEETVQALGDSITGRIDLKHEYEGDNLWVIGDLHTVRKNLSKLIRTTASRTMDNMREITVKTGVVSSDSECLAECSVQQNLGDGNYAFLEVQGSIGEIKHASRPTVFYPFIRLKGFDGYCLADPVIQGVQETYHGILHVVISGSGESALSRILIPIKQNVADQTEC